MRTFETATKTDWIVDRALRGIIRSALALPYATRVRWFGAVIEKVVAPLAGYRKRAEDQLAFIWPDMPEAERRTMAKAVCNNFGRTMIENYSGAGFAKQIETAKVSGEGLAALAQAKEEGRPVLFVTGHFGNHEAPRQALVQRGYTIGGLYRPIANPYFNAHYEKNMLEMSGAVFPQGRKGTIGFVKMLKQGGMGTLLFDVRATRHPQIPFMGQPAHTATSVADIALKINALVIPYFGIRQPDGLSFEVTVQAPIALTDPAQMMAEITARLEARIKANPEQWFWIHRRWG
ncbi:lauroyl acyltransferase [Octadecabacter sp. 1_MG-2023]|uniref:lysophospholipid acyltransferase family protein n=1 Tax=unclassified Octadecabacter TaxID=196158 RepID=UPI001C0A5588|nr:MULTISPECIES: lauroyl acyltransferase [unclassified Octadecabacter]MBU2994685.1 lauroyl acyltransferase [Octadecabacter sp. B2R22]MDO6734021.1 lauroyl acyltransferase [Octadecabacter sp. 1_MG-2023]